MNIITHNDLTIKANTLIKDAKAILLSDDASAEQIEKADRMIADAQNMLSRAGNLEELERRLKTAQVVPSETVEDDMVDNHAFKSLGDFALAAWNKYKHNTNDSRLVYFSDNGGARKAMAEGTAADGGALVPEEFRPELMSIAAERGIMRSRATVIPMSRRTMNIPVLDQTQTNVGVPNFFGGISARWTEEAEQKNETSPKFRNIELVAHKLALITYASDELLDDSAIGLEAFLRSERGFAGAIAWQEDYTFLRGSGAGQPLGVLNAGATITVNRQSDSPRVTFPDIANMMTNFLPGGMGMWIASQTLMADLLTMNGPSGNPSYLWGSAQAGVPNTLLGYPIIFTEKLPAAGNDGDLLLIDPTYYLIGDRQNTTIDVSVHNRFEYDQTTWRGVHRVDGQPWLSAPITYSDGTTQVSPFVKLGVKSS